MTIELSRHPSTHAWGRNGSFVPATAYVGGYYGNVYLEAVSSKPGKNPPLKLHITSDDAIRIAKALLAAAKEAG